MTTFPEPPASAGQTARALWERRVARNYDQYMQGDVPIRVLERRYGKTGAQLAAIAERNEVRIASTVKTTTKAQRGRKAA